MVEYVCLAFPHIEAGIGLIHTDYMPGERIVRCRNCAMYDEDDEMCVRDPEHTGRGWHACPEGFCKWAVPRDNGDKE